MMNVRLFHAGRGRAAAGRRSPALYALALILAAAGAVSAQTPDDAPIRELIARLDRGETEAVRQQLPELVAKYQNHPGMLYVQARVATDGIEAAKLYQSVLDNYPASEWADDALYNLYQYYYAMGLYKTAELKMQQLRKEYPSSEHLTGKPVPPELAGGDSRPGPPQLPPPAAADTAGAAPAAGEPGRGDLPVRVPPKEDARGREAIVESPAGDARVPGEAGRTDSTGDRNPPGETVRPEQTVMPERPGIKEPPSAVATPYTLQTGAFSTSENARRQKEWFEDRGYAAEITNRVRGGRSLYLVWVGSFRTPDEARKVLAEIQSRFNITPIVVER